MDITYKIVTGVPGYRNSSDARNHSNQASIIQPATYYIYNESDGMINLTSQKGIPGHWINPEDNKQSDDPVNDKQDNDKTISKKETSSRNKPSYSTTTTPSLRSSGSNKRVYRITKDYIPCYIINTVTGGTIEFDCEPDEISDTVSAQFDPQEIRGRSSPYQGYNSSGPRTLSFSLILHDDLCKEGILNTINRLKSLVYPGYGGVLSTPACLVRIGDMIHMKAIVSDVGVSWQKPYRNGVYLLAEVSLTLSEVVDTPHSASDIWKKGGYI